MRIKLTRNQFAIIDKADENLINNYSWYCSSHGYATHKRRGEKALHMHRLIMGNPQGMEVDHINGNSLDNRRVNLRICTHQQNLYNSKLSRRNVSGYKGVSWDKVNKKWRATIHAKDGIIHLGRFAEVKEAAQAYNEAASEHYGDFARLNSL